MMNNLVSNSIKKPWFVLSEAFSSFRKNNDLTAASSLAFYAMLAIIPALYLLTILLSAVIGSSAQALQKTQEFMSQFVPAYSQVILKEVGFITSHRGAIGLVNLFVLFWSITPFVSELRISLGTIFPKGRSRPFLLEKLFDVAISIIFLIGFSAVAVVDVVLTLMKRIRPLRLLPIYLEEFTPFIVVTGVVFSLYFTFSSKMRARQLIIGSLVTSLLWFAMRPAFHLFLTYNPGYGFAFGSFKSLFVVIIWIYYFLVVFLFGAEIAAASTATKTSS
jgi:membrane protein